MCGVPENSELEQPAQKVAIPLLGAELSVPGEVVDGRFISMALAEMLGGPETQFPIKKNPDSAKENTSNQDLWIKDVANALRPKSDALTHPARSPSEEKWENKVAEALNHQPPKTLILDFEAIEPIHWQEYSNDSTLSINALVTIRNILEFLLPLQKLATADSESIKIEAHLHFNLSAFKALAPDEQAQTFSSRVMLAQEQFIQLFELLKEKLGIKLPIQVVTQEVPAADLTENRERISSFWEFTNAKHARNMGDDPTGNEPIKAWKSMRSKRAPRVWGNTAQYSLTLAGLLDDRAYREQYESTPGVDFFGHLTPEFKFDLLTKIALTQGLLNQTYSELIANQDLVDKAIDWLAALTVVQNTKAAQNLAQAETETHFIYRMSPHFVDERAGLAESETGKMHDAMGVVKPARGYFCFKPLAGISDMDVIAVPEFVRYQEPSLTEEEVTKVIRASLSKKIQSTLIGGDKTLAELFLKFSNAKLTVRNTTDPDYAARPGKTYTAQIAFPELPDLTIPVKIRVAQKRDPS